MVTPWIEYIDNPRAMNGVYDSVPDLQGARLMALEFTLNGMSLTIDLQAPPTRRTRRTPDGANRVQIRLEGAPLRSVTIAALAPFDTVNLRLMQEADGLVICSDAGPNIFTVRCGGLRIAEARAYLDAAR